MENTSLETLTALQKECGYNDKGINIIAILGLFGEAGELLESWHQQNEKCIPVSMQFLIDDAVRIAKKIDNLKKDIRDRVITFPKCSGKFNHDTKVEASDVVYYLNAVAIGMGHTLNYLASLSELKVRNRTKVNVEMGVDHLEMPDWSRSKKSKFTTESEFIHNQKRLISDTVGIPMYNTPPVDDEDYVCSYCGTGLIQCDVDKHGNVSYEQHRCLNEVVKGAYLPDGDKRPHVFNIEPE